MEEIMPRQEQAERGSGQYPQPFPYGAHMDMPQQFQRYRDAEAARTLFVQHLAEECAGLQLSVEGEKALPHLQMGLATFIDALDLPEMEVFLQQAEEASTHDRAEEERGLLGASLLTLTTIMPGQAPAMPHVAARVGMAMVANLAAHCPDFPLNDLLSCARRALRQTFR
ncbi:hypothetical protein [Streptomyces chrestomyceticus]|uniref:hypothetical protein n=1 Tax=Streptomyces chrestomyceticus TaxID=68185 RepID=UPI0033EE4846